MKNISKFLKFILFLFLFFLTSLFSPLTKNVHAVTSCIGMVGAVGFPGYCVTTNFQCLWNDGNTYPEQAPQKCVFLTPYCCVPNPGETGTCTLTVLQPVVINEAGGGGIVNGKPNATYSVNITGPGSCSAAGFTTNASGVGAFNLTCTTAGSYSVSVMTGTVTVPASIQTCSASFIVLSSKPSEGLQCVNLPSCQGDEKDCTIVLDYQIGADCFYNCSTKPIKCTNPARASDTQYLFDCCASDTGGTGPVPPSSGGTKITSIMFPIKIFCKNGSGPPVADGSSQEIYTALGCIPISDIKEIAKFVLRFGMGIAGGIGLILIVVAGFQIITSGGNPQKLNAGKELLTSVVMGLVLLLFGMYLLRLIGVNILNIPDFGK